MKLIKFLIFSIIILGFISSQLLKGQDNSCPPCSLDVNCQWKYPGDPSVYDESWPYFEGDPSTYERPLYTTINYQGNVCHFRVIFKMRECYCPNLRQELFLERIDFENEACESIPKSEIISKAIQQLLYESQVIFRDTLSSYSVTVQTPKCWRLDDENNQLITCNSECCITRYWIELIGRHVHLFDKEKLLPPPTNCPSPGGLSCEEICDGNDVPLGEIFTDEMEGCPDDECPDVEWNDKPTFKTSPPKFYHAKNTVLTGLYGCNPRVFYETKKCPDGHIEVRIKKIVEFADACPKEDADVKEYITRAIRLILKNLTLDYYYPPYLDYTTKITVRIYDCWEFITPRRLVPCNYSSCCSQDYWCEYTFRQDPDDLKVYYTTVVDYDYTKTFIPNVNCIDHCQPICISTVFNYPGNWIITKRAFQNEESIEPKYLSGDSKINIQPIPAENRLEILFESTHKGAITIKISDVIGNSILTQSQEKKDLKTIFDIDLANYTNGVYFYEIIIDNVTDKRGQFIILK